MMKIRKYKLGDIAQIENTLSYSSITYLVL